MRFSIYRIHRSLSIVIAVPVLIWASSGFMHPLMTNIRPAIATQGIRQVAIDSSKLRVPLSVALRKHHMDSLSNFRLVHIDTNWFYQVRPATGRPAGGMAGSAGFHGPGGGIPVYISCNNGNILPAGDWLYAQYLARQFLEGPDSSTMNGGKVSEGVADCCGAATTCVLNPARGAKVTNVSMVKDFNDEYKSINRLLPVYCVAFDRPDGIRIYVETTQDRFSFAMDNRRAVFDEIFRLFHTWGWLDFLGKGKLVIEMLLALTALSTTLLGIYIFFTTRSKKVKGNSLVKARRNHRMVSIVASLFTVLWTFSGSYHAFAKFKDDDRRRYSASDNFPAAATEFAYDGLEAAIGRPPCDISLVQMAGQTYWRVSAVPVIVAAHKDLMVDNKAAFKPVYYVHTGDYRVLPDGDARYARWLATQWSGHPATAIRGTGPITSFGDEYNFTDKRLPVWKVSYALDRNERWYIETCSGQLASRVDDRIAAEGYSFSVFHKHHFMDWAGKTVRDLSTMFWALAQVVMVVVGLILWFRYRGRRNLRKAASCKPTASE